MCFSNVGGVSSARISPAAVIDEIVHAESAIARNLPRSNRVLDDITPPIYCPRPGVLDVTLGERASYIFPDTVAFKVVVDPFRPIDGSLEMKRLSNLQKRLWVP